MTTVLDYLPPDAIYDQYSEPMCSLGSLAAFYGVSASVVHARLQSDPVRYAQAQSVKARHLHEIAIGALFEEPERIVDAAGSDRIDPASVQLMKLRSGEASRLAGILDHSLSERQTLAVVHTVSPLADYINRIASQGSTIAITQGTIDVEDAEIVDADQL
jgi:hypothetical protein